MNVYVIDTDIFVDELRNFKSGVDFFTELENNNIYGLASTVSIAELFAGNDCETDEGIRAVEDITNLIETVEVSQQIAKKAGEIKRKYKIAITDSIIAATAIIKDITLVTRNSKDFSKIKELKIKIPY
ncbi:MAG: type II toxin-antitoxin system VapC family toxin [Candidatus Aenigmarchaeota archaeon]|nr:type II toxin-antitoxin system VapC family toxin [Candidatus Aenigmarchaeota archaeon]